MENIIEIYEFIADYKFIQSLFENNEWLFLCDCQQYNIYIDKLETSYVL